MHPLVPFLLGEPHPHGKRLTNVQKSLRTDDIDEVGDAWHNTFFEMLGNWSLGDYWKEKSITWSLEFLTEELKLDPKRIYVTVFGGDKEIPGIGEDKGTIDIWKKLGIPENKIYKLGKADNWWGPVGQEGPCGPDTEMFYDTGAAEHGAKCQPGETCGKYAEIWNNVFMEFNKTANGEYEALKQKNVDTGMGVERTTAILQGKDNIYDTELFKGVIDLLEEKSKDFNLKDARIIADHMRATLFLISDGVEPSNKDQGYILRRLIRRSAYKAIYRLKSGSLPSDLIFDIYINIYKNAYPDISEKKKQLTMVTTREFVKFERTLEQGIRKFEEIKKKESVTISGRDVFYLHATHGLTIDIVKDWALEDGLKVDEKGFEDEFEKHQEISRAGGKQKVAGGLEDQSEKTIRGHTATHLLHKALRDVLGEAVHQTGSNITTARIRFDFSYGEKMTPEQIKKVEEVVNKKIKEDLRVKKTLMTQGEAEMKGAIGLFPEKYEDKVSIYQIGDYSIEYCGGPHVETTSKVGKFKIVKEESVGSGSRRIKAVLN